MDSGKTCFRSGEEQLYMLELLVDKLNLSSEKVQEAGITPLCVRMKFLDFPPFEISQAEFSGGKKKREKEDKIKGAAADRTVDFSAGKSCLFTKQPRDLVQAMQTRPLAVGVFKIRNKTPCEVYSDDRSMCKTEVPLSGCLCDQVAMAMNDANHLPKPYTLKNSYNLLDEEKTPSGTIAIFLRLSCFGKSIVTHFALQEKSFLFKSSESSDEFQCTRILPDEEELSRRSRETKDKICVPEGSREPEENLLPKPRDVIGLAPICQELVKRDGGPMIFKPPLRAPSPAPRIPMEDPNFVKLTSAEKLNDRDYRGLVYRAHPNQPICSCACSPGGNFLNSLTGEFPCTGVACGGGCCVGTRRLEPPARDHHGGSDQTPCYTGSCCSGKPRIPGNKTGGSSFQGPRMRGGGCCDGDVSETLVKSSRQNPYYANQADSGAPEIKTLMSGVCGVPRSEKISSKKTGCGCYGKSGAGEIQNRSALGKGGGSCTKKPCLGIDCLLRAFKETQDFVDSIGKVPGLAGLGLPDPSESPYFGRDRDDGENTCAEKKTPGYNNSRHPSATSFQFPSKNQVPGTRINPGIPISVAPNIYTSGLAGRTGVVREAIPTLPEVNFTGSARAKKKDERTDKLQKEMEMNTPPQIDIEIGPCGEPRCKARRKKNQEFSTTEGQSKVSLSRKLPAQVKPSSGGGGGSLKTNILVPAGGGLKILGKIKQVRNQPQGYNPGPGGDRIMNSNSKSCVKVSRKIMKFVYTAGASYPGINYGHKNCLDSRMRVPANMGWLWNTNQVVGRLKPRLGWKPGAISRFMNEMLRQAKMSGGKENGSSSRPTSSSSRNKKGKMLKNKSRSSPSVNKGQGMSKKKECEEEESELPPTLHIHRKDGTYYVTMYPIKQETMEVPQLQEPMKPLQFKITKNKDDGSIASSSTASDMEIEFSPPAAVNRYRKKPNVVNVETQVKQQEIVDALKPPGSKKAKGAGKGSGKKGKKK